MKRLLIFLSLFLFTGLSFARQPEEDYNCSTLIIGRDASANGCVIIAHNEDDGGNQIVNFYKIPGKDNRKGGYVRFKEGATEPQVSHSFACLWMEMPGQDFADTYLNENGVLVTSNACSSKELFGEITDGGIGYELRRMIAERALSARIGVELAGYLVEKWGYNGSGRTYIIADKNEAWLFAVVRGKNWVAQKVPDNHVAFIPNYYTITEIDTNDSENYLASKDLINYAVRRGWYNPSTDGRFNFTKVYSSARNLTSMSNIGRMWIALNLLSGKEYKKEDQFPFSFAPQRKIEMKDIYNFLSNHYEGTDLDDSNNYTRGSPHSNKTQNICASHQQLSFVAELRQGLPFDIGGRIWVAPRRGCVNVYMPIYYGVTEFPANMNMDTPEKAYELHFKRDESIYDRTRSLAWWNFVAVAECTDQDFIKRYPERKRTKEELQKTFAKMTSQLEKDYLPIYKKQPEKAALLINSFTKEVLERTISENNKFLRQYSCQQ
ncbi:MAG: C69 family dipeptidase [Bacteroidales bacterium]